MANYFSMNSFIVLSILLFGIVSAEKYAVVVGGVDHWSRYSATSEPCRVYDNLIAGGIKPENIIYMTFTRNTIIGNNPYPKMLFTNEAETTDGDWMQYGCLDHVDYVEEEIKPKVFLAILKGDKETVKELTGKEDPKVLKTTSEDTIFTYIISDGDTGKVLIGSNQVFTDDLTALFQYAHENKLYKNWVWLVESCFSSTLFTGLPSDLGIYAIASSDDKNEPRMGCCPPHDVIAGRGLYTCLGSYWENILFEYMENHADATIGELFMYSHEEVAKGSDQNVSEFGDMGMKTMKISEFVGEWKQWNNGNGEVLNSHSSSSSTTTSITPSSLPIHIAKWKAIRASSLEEYSQALKEYSQVVKRTAKQEMEVMRLSRVVLKSEQQLSVIPSSSSLSYSIACMERMMNGLKEHCGTDYVSQNGAKMTKTVRLILQQVCQVENGNHQVVDWEEVCV